MLSDRFKTIFDELTSNPGITSMELEEKFSLTRRQLGYRIDKINDWLMTMKLPVIERTRKGHFILDPSIMVKFGGHQQISSTLDTAILTEDQRVRLILLMLLSAEEELSLNHFVFELDVSKNTILSDLKEAQSFVDPYELMIRYSRKYGYLLEGKEFQIRKLLMDIANFVLQMSNGEKTLRKITGIHIREVEEFKNRIEKVEDSLNLKYTDEKLRAMPYILILINRRVEQGHIIHSFSIEYEELSGTKEYKATEEILRDAENIPVTERLFITLHLLTTSVFSSGIENDDSLPDLVPAIDSMLRQFEKSACIYLQDRNQLLDKLLQHIKPAYYRVKYQLTDTIIFQGPLNTEFKGLHHLVKRSISPLKELIGNEMPENEISFITMLIGGWMKRQGESIEKKVKAIVVCPQGISVSRLMFHELNELFPEFVFLDYLSVREFLQYPLEYDVVFAPIYLETEKKLFVTKAFLGLDEKVLLRKRVMLSVHGFILNQINIKDVTKVIKKFSTIHDEDALLCELENLFQNEDYSFFMNEHAESANISLNQLITPETITLTDSVASWEDAVRLSAKPLLRNGTIKPEYVDAMISYSEKDPYIVIGPNIAIPHAAPEDGVNEVGMSLLRIKNGVRYSNDYHIQLIITISAVDKHKHIHALMQLMKLAGSEHDRNQLVQANSVGKVYEIINAFSTD